MYIKFPVEDVRNFPRNHFNGEKYFKIPRINISYDTMNTANISIRQ